MFIASEYKKTLILFTPMTQPIAFRAYYEYIYFIYTPYSPVLTPQLFVQFEFVRSASCYNIHSPNRIWSWTEIAYLVWRIIITWFLFAFITHWTPMCIQRFERNALEKPCNRTKGKHTKGIPLQRAGTTELLSNTISRPLSRAMFGNDSCARSALLVQWECGYTRFVCRRCYCCSARRRHVCVLFVGFASVCVRFRKPEITAPTEPTEDEFVSYDSFSFGMLKRSLRRAYHQIVDKK